MANVHAGQSIQLRRQEGAFTVIAVALLALLSLVYFLAAGRLAAAQPLWMDEVLAVWIARLPSAAAVWQALEKGAEFSPPLYHLLLQKIIQFGGGGHLALRVPSIIAVYVVSAAAFVLVRRRHSAPVAALAMALCLTSGLYPFALQVRQYACVAGCFALALVLWDIPGDRSPSLRASVAMLALLVIAVGMHFYAVLLAAALGLMELIWTATHRRIRWLHVAVVALACLSVLLWLPILEHAAAFNRGDAAASGYYGRPLVIRLVSAYLSVLVGHRWIWLSPLTLLLLAVIARVLAVFGGESAARPRCGAPDNLDIIVGVTCAIPLLVFLFAREVTHTFELRYVIVAALGLAIFASRLFGRLPQSAAFCCLLLFVSTGLALSPDRGAAAADKRSRVLALVDQAPPGLPIVTGNGLRFFEIAEGAGAAVADRLVYLKTPAGIDNPDPTNEHQVERWAAIAPQLAVMDLTAFLKSHARFVVFSDHSGVDLLPGLLARRGYRLRMIAQAGDAYLAEVGDATNSSPPRS